MASEVSICNSAIQKLGGERITSLDQDSRNARSVNACYTEMRDAELRAHKWNFARKSVILAPDSTAPVDTDYTYAFTLPSDCLKPIPPNTYDLDWQVENNKILTNDGTSLKVKYVQRTTDANSMDVLFREMLACRIAIQICYEITQSNTLLDGIGAQYRMAKLEAKKSNSFEQSSEEPPEDSWVAARR